MVLALLSETAFEMAHYCMNSERVTMTNEDGNEYEHMVKPSTESIVNALPHLTLTSFKDGRGPYKNVTINWSPSSGRL